MDELEEDRPDEGTIEDRPDTGRGFWNIGWPLLALGLIVLMAVHACVPHR